MLARPSYPTHCSPSLAQSQPIETQPHLCGRIALWSRHITPLTVMSMTSLLLDVLVNSRMYLQPTTRLIATTLEPSISIQRRS